MDQPAPSSPLRPIAPGSVLSPQPRNPEAQQEASTHGTAGATLQASELLNSLQQGLPRSTFDELRRAANDDAVFFELQIQLQQLGQPLPAALPSAHTSELEQQGLRIFDQLRRSPPRINIPAAHGDDIANYLLKIVKEALTPQLSVGAALASLAAAGGAGARSGSGQVGLLPAEAATAAAGEASVGPGTAAGGQASSSSIAAANAAQLGAGIAGGAGADYVPGLNQSSAAAAAASLEAAAQARVGGSGYASTPFFTGAAFEGAAAAAAGGGGVMTGWPGMSAFQAAGGNMPTAAIGGGGAMPAPAARTGSEAARHELLVGSLAAGAGGGGGGQGGAEAGADFVLGGYPYMAGMGQPPAAGAAATVRAGYQGMTQAVFGGESVFWAGAQAAAAAAAAAVAGTEGVAGAAGAGGVHGGLAGAAGARGFLDRGASGEASGEAGGGPGVLDVAEAFQASAQPRNDLLAGRDLLARVASILPQNIFGPPSDVQQQAEYWGVTPTYSSGRGAGGASARNYNLCNVGRHKLNLWVEVDGEVFQVHFQHSSNVVKKRPRAASPPFAAGTSNSAAGSGGLSGTRESGGSSSGSLAGGLAAEPGTGNTYAAATAGERDVAAGDSSQQQQQGRTRLYSIGIHMPGKGDPAVGQQVFCQLPGDECFVPEQIKSGDPAFRFLKISYMTCRRNDQ